MAQKSEIEWTDATWNPVTGCTKVGPGCDHCYAERFAERWRGIKDHPYEQGFDMRLWPTRLGQPAVWKKPRVIFVNSMSDLFHKDIPYEFIDRVFDAMEAADWHVYQVLTKRSSLMRNLAPSLKARNIRGVAFLDPYGAHLEWTTLKALADTGTMEVVINFPLAMAINRLITRSGNVPDRWADQLTSCFGTDEWRDIAYRREVDLFGNEVTTKNGDVADRLLDLYVSRLNTLFPFVAKPHLIRNTRKAPLYYLIWAGPKKLGLKGADYILRQGERV